MVDGEPGAGRVASRPAPPPGAAASAQQPPAQVFIAMHGARSSCPAPARPARPRRRQHDAAAAALEAARTEERGGSRSRRPNCRGVCSGSPGCRPRHAALAAREALRRLMRDFAFATLVPFGRERSGVLLRAAARAGCAVRAAVAHRGRVGAGRGRRRCITIPGAGSAVRYAWPARTMRLEGFLLAGDIGAEAGVRPLLQNELPAQAACCCCRRRSRWRHAVGRLQLLRRERSADRRGARHRHRRGRRGWPSCSRASPAPAAVRACPSCGG